MGCPFWRIIAIVRALSINKMRDGGGPELLAGLPYSSERFDTMSRRATSSHCSPARHTAMQCSNIQSCLDSQEKEYRHGGLMIGTCFRIACYHAWCFMRNGIRELGKLV
ncbi:hypothetical protein D5086_015320 [Populus alba]|uniref:Uncharacterized protein n=1 Tax=Populus alba TaxID=43335 RepID=A0ACC4C1G8_POPAL